MSDLLSLLAAAALVSGCVLVGLAAADTLKERRVRRRAEGRGAPLPWRAWWGI